jgi:hypothetical protein
VLMQHCFRARDKIYQQKLKDALIAVTNQPLDSVSRDRPSEPKISVNYLNANLGRAAMSELKNHPRVGRTNMHKDMLCDF